MKNIKSANFLCHFQFLLSYLVLFILSSSSLFCSWHSGSDHRIRKLYWGRCYFPYEHTPILSASRDSGALIHVRDHQQQHWLGLSIAWATFLVVPLPRKVTEELSKEDLNYNLFMLLFCNTHFFWNLSTGFAYISDISTNFPLRINSGCFFTKTHPMCE